jgi:tetratricopeptide (TPR) repeat protein
MSRDRVRKGVTKVATSGRPGRDHRLKSWKEIAAFFGTDERTARRWEARGLPVVRVPGGARPTIYAEIGALETWLAGRGSEEAAATGARPARRRSPFLIGMLLAGAGMLVALAMFAAFSSTLSADQPAAAPQIAAHQPPAHARELYLAGVYHWERRTPEALHRAMILFNQAIALDRDYAEAWAGIADCYILLREFGGMDEPTAYRLAQQAADRALALDDRLARAHSALGFVSFHGFNDYDRGLSSLRRGISLDPGDATAWHWYATAADEAGHSDQALQAIDEAQRLRPADRSILADKGWILYHGGRLRPALALLRDIEANEPEFQSPHRYLSIIALATGDDAGYLREARLYDGLHPAAHLRGELDAAGQALAAGGHPAMLRRLIEIWQREHEAGAQSAYQIAWGYALLGDRYTAVRWLQQSVRANELAGLTSASDPVFARLRSPGPVIAPCARPQDCAT